ncbi:nuclear transport factor 2 family protein [Paraburkholderia sp.]|uniref:nuclear transport factor 2 family protein n=1 Tax=Paraburkholderia sp. TaxID=1926495 RepID=UPI0039E27408
MFDSQRMSMLQRLLDKEEIRESLCRYARGVDRGDWDLVRSTYHADAYDEHGDYVGGIDGFIEYLDRRFSDIDNSVHFLGNSLIEFSGPDVALVETYFVSRRLRPASEVDGSIAGPEDAIARELWGRYVDRFERRNAEWKVAHRTVVREAFSSAVALGGRRYGNHRWGRRDGQDRLYELRAEIFQGK